MVLRETQFLVGGFAMIGLGVALGYGLYWGGAGWEFVDAWFAAALAIGLGLFFVRVARAERRERRRFLAGDGAAPGPDENGRRRRFG